MVQYDTSPLLINSSRGDQALKRALSTKSVVERRETRDVNDKSINQLIYFNIPSWEQITYTDKCTCLQINASLLPCLKCYTYLVTNQRTALAVWTGVGFINTLYSSQSQCKKAVRHRDEQSRSYEKPVHHRGKDRMAILLPLTFTLEWASGTILIWRRCNDPNWRCCSDPKWKAPTPLLIPMYMSGVCCARHSPSSVCQRRTVNTAENAPMHANTFNLFILMQYCAQSTW